MAVCRKCGKSVTADEIGATKKFINRGSTEYFCLPCLSQELKVPEQMLRDKIEYFRRTGCTLFPSES